MRGRGVEMHRRMVGSPLRRGDVWYFFFAGVILWNDMEFDWGLCSKFGVALENVLGGDYVN